MHNMDIQCTCSQVWGETWSGRILRLAEREAESRQKVRAILKNRDMNNCTDYMDYHCAMMSFKSGLCR